MTSEHQYFTRKMYSFFLLLLHSLSVLAFHGLPLETQSQWSFHRKLYEYKAYGAITLERIEIPQHTVVLNLSFNAYSDSKDCDSRSIKIFANYQGLPVVSRNGETFPDNVFVSEESVLNISITTDNKTVNWELANLQAGQLFLMSIMPRKDTRIKQQGLGEDCEYYISLKSTLQYAAPHKLSQLNVDVKNEVTVNNQKLTSFYIPADVVSYMVEVSGCPEPCPIQVFSRATLRLLWNKTAEDCHWVNGTCRIPVDFPIVESNHYISFLSSVNTSTKLTVSVLTSYCKTSLFKPAHHHKLPPNDTCYLLYHLGRETPARAEEGSNMFDHFVCWDKTMAPHSSIDVKALDTMAAIMSYRLRVSDVGSSMKVTLHFPKQELPTEADIYLCVTAFRMANALRCDDGALIKLSTLNDTEKNIVVIPYPQSGLWYVSLQSQCFKGNESSKHIVRCTKEPQVNITIHLTPCLDGGCGQYGSCKLYFESNILYSSCSCFAGWRGYGCNDGSNAESDKDLKIGVYLLTISNLSFLPGIILAFYRRHYVEAIVYAYNMFFSTFYHACDTSQIYQLCIMPYNVLSFADFFASLLSFWVTLLAMARVVPALRSFCHVIGVLFIAVAVVLNRHGLFEQLVPIAVGVAAVIVSWGREAYKRRQLFPSKRRLLFFILPGVLLACLGLIFNLALETEENYKYMHSLWHCTVSASIIFLLPPRRGDKNKIGGRNLSVQSGDIIRDGLLSDDDIHAEFHRADEPDADSEPSSPVNSSRDRGGSFRLTARERRRNLIL